MQEILKEFHELVKGSQRGRQPTPTQPPPPSSMTTRRRTSASRELRVSGCWCTARSSRCVRDSSTLGPPVWGGEGLMEGLLLPFVLVCKERASNIFTSHPQLRLRTCPMGVPSHPNAPVHCYPSCSTPSSKLATAAATSSSSAFRYFLSAFFSGVLPQFLYSSSSACR